MGKSAQLPLTVWLPDAMAGPTPVSALIHAATMVTAGTYLLMRLFPLVSLSPTAMLVIAGVGAVTALYASFAALAQWDIKKMLAYSTISQVGYMFLAVGAGDIVGGLFHLVSHAFFKALLFLAAGIVIQALAEEHNIFRMGNLRRRLPAVYWLFLIGAVSLSAFPLLGGFFSKDRILLATFIHPGATYKIFWLLGLAAAFLTPLYTFRVFFVAFPERPDGRGAETDPAHPPVHGLGAVAPGDLRPGRRPAQPAGGLLARTFWAIIWPSSPGPGRTWGLPWGRNGPWELSAPPSWWSPSPWLIGFIAAGRPGNRPWQAIGASCFPAFIWTGSIS